MDFQRCSLTCYNLPIVKHISFHFVIIESVGFNCIQRSIFYKLLDRALAISSALIIAYCHEICNVTLVKTKIYWFRPRYIA